MSITSSKLRTYLLSFLNGLVLGLALLISNIYQPLVLRNQFSLRDNYFLESFLIANLVSVFIVYSANTSEFAKLACRKDTSFWGQNFSGNILGGALQGVGMYLADADPGTALVQFALGVRGWEHAWALMAGCVSGGVVFVAAEPILKRWKNSKVEVKMISLTLQDVTGMPIATTAMLYAVFCAAVIMVLNVIRSPSRGSSDVASYNALTSGILIGLAQLCSVLLTRKTLGVSSVFEDLGRYITDGIPSRFISLINQAQIETSSKRTTSARPTAMAEHEVQPRNPLITTALVFSCGILLSARVATSVMPSIITSQRTIANGLSWEQALASEFPPAVHSGLLSFAGATLLIFGARLAGGCTSGHGISGMATLSLASFVTVGSIFAAGTVMGMLFA